MTATLEMNPTIIGIGMGLPERVIDNDAFVHMLAEHGQESSDEAIRQRTGIESRRWVSGNENLITLGVAAAHGALEMSGIAPDSLGDIYVGTSGPSGPSVASHIHGAVGAGESCGVLDINAACAGGVRALQLAARGMTAEGQSSALAVGVDILSGSVDLGDRRSAILFGDGGGAGVFGWCEGAITPVSVRLSRHDPAAIYRDPTTGKIVMSGQRVAMHALHIIPEAMRRAAQLAGFADPDDPKAAIDWSKIDYFVPHQANKRLIEKAGEVLEVPEAKLITASVEVHGNTSAASVFLGMVEAYNQGIIEPGMHTIAFSAIGAGMAGGAYIGSICLPERSIITYPGANAGASLAA